MPHWLVLEEAMLVCLCPTCIPLCLHAFVISLCGWVSGGCGWMVCALPVCSWPAPCVHISPLCHCPVPLDLSEIKAYIDSFRYGAPPHAGGGIGKSACIVVSLAYVLTLLPLYFLPVTYEAIPLTTLVPLAACHAL